MERNLSHQDMHPPPPGSTISVYKVHNCQPLELETSDENFILMVQAVRDRPLLVTGHVYFIRH